MLVTTSGHKRWIIACLLIAAPATAYYMAYHRYALNGPTGGSWPGLVYGIGGSALMLFAGLLPIRRKMPTQYLGPATTWMKGHIWLGLLSVPFILFHSGLQLGGALTTVLMLLFGLVVLSGVFGLVVQQILPRMMMTQVPMETIYEEIPHVLDQLRKEAEELVTAACGSIENPSPLDPDKVGAGPDGLDRPSAPLLEGGPLKEFYRHQIQPYLHGGGHEGDLATRAKAIVLFQEMRTLLPPRHHLTLSDLEAICEERRQLALQSRLHLWLHGWLLLHTPLSTGLLLLAAAHAVIALRY
ncbi:MAG: hypothetical protein HY278_10870 [candidate division NC10 bacterium]|nr:hypothetical protein [candidate division NC10 bacterium]